jgi:hypothetical protein
MWYPSDCVASENTEQEGPDRSGTFWFAGCHLGKLTFQSVECHAEPRLCRYVVVMHSGGSHLSQLTRDRDWLCKYPSWFPAGKRLTVACSSPPRTSVTSSLVAERPSKKGIFVIAADNPSLNPTPIIDGDADAPVFAPSNWIASFLAPD